VPYRRRRQSFLTGLLFASVVGLILGGGILFVVFGLEPAAKLFRDTFMQNPWSR
jgi:hypothetical protein